MRLSYTHTRIACYISYITQAITINLAPLFFIIFQDRYAVSYSLLGQLVLITFVIQLMVDFVSIRLLERIGYRVAAIAAHVLGIPDCSVVVPLGTPHAKTDRIRFYGARSMMLGADYDDALTLGINYIDRAEMFYVDPFEHDTRVYAGQGTIGLEIMEQNPDVDTIVVPIGGGGLCTGIAVAAKSVKPSARIVGVLTAACPAMVDSIRDNVCYSRFPTEGDTVCEAIVGGVGEIAFDMLPSLIDDIVVVSEKSIRSAFKFMIEREQLSVEAGSAMVVAAVREFPERVGGKNVALVISGGNLDINILTSVLAGDFEE